MADEAKISKQSAKGKRGGPRKNAGGARAGAGRPMVSSPEERDAIEEARAKGRAYMPVLMDIWIGATAATKTEWVKSADGWTDVGQAPDWTTRLRAIEQIAARVGLPTQTDITVSAAGASILAIMDKFEETEGD